MIYSASTAFRQSGLLEDFILEPILKGEDPLLSIRFLFPKVRNKWDWLTNFLVANQVTVNNESEPPENEALSGCIREMH